MFNRLGDAFKSIEYSTVIEFKELNEKIFITSRRWGLGGQHFHIVISNLNHANDDVPINKEREIVLDNRCGLYYKKQEPNCLIVFLPSNSNIKRKDICRKINNIDITIKEVDKSTYNNFKKEYKVLGLSPIICPNNIE